MSQIMIGDKVTTTEENPTVTGWRKPEDRRWGVSGGVFNESDSHGLCYQVKHDDGSLGWYDPSELTKS